MSDWIEREDAIKAVIEAMDKHCNGYNSFRDMRIRKAIEGVPSADRLQGQWIYCEDDSGHDGYKCSECGYFVPWCYDAQSCDFIWNYNFCPHCGADMRERKDFQVIVNGNCAKCGKPLSGNRIFICEECEEQSKESK